MGICLPLNLYVLFQVASDAAVSPYEQIMAGKRKPVLQPRLHEIESMRKFCEAMRQAGADIRDLDGFFANFTIPQISKEFDLLKLDAETVLNIELKSVNVGRGEIARQLRQNRYYLKHLKREIIQFTYVMSENCFYCLDAQDKLRTCPVGEPLSALESLDSRFFKDDLNTLFTPSSFLVSPVDDPDQFLQHQYFLTQHQMMIEESVFPLMEQTGGSRFVSITGAAGTGKTLLLYDMARIAAKYGRVLMVHCAEMGTGLHALNEKIREFDIVEDWFLGDLKVLRDYRFVFIDETHRMDSDCFAALLATARKSRLFCVFSSDADQVLSRSQKKAAVVKQIKAIPQLLQFELTTKIRTNQELASFIGRLQNRALVEENSYSYQNVTLLYAASLAEAKTIIRYYQQCGFVYISCRRNENGRSSPRGIIGREYPKVLVSLDRHFHYDGDEHLVADMAADEEYLYEQLFYQAVTRVKETLGLLVIDNPRLFSKITELFFPQSK